MSENKKTLNITNLFKNIIKINKNIKKTIIWKIISSMIPSIIGIIVIVLIFHNGPKSAAVSIIGNSKSVEINKFIGRIDCTSNIIDFGINSSGTIVNQTSIFLNLNNERYDLSPGDLRIVYIPDENSPPQVKNITSTEKINFGLLDTNLEKINLKKSGIIQTFSPIGDVHTLNLLGFTEYYTGSTDADNFQFYVQGKMKLYIKNKLIKSDSNLSMLNFNKKDTKSISIFQFENFNETTFMVADQDTELMMSGDADCISGIFEDGKLSANITSEEQTYELDMKEVKLESSDNNNLEISYSKNLTVDRNYSLAVIGESKVVNISKRSIFPTFSKWYIENMYAITATIISILLGFIIFKNNKE